jgi:aryl-alcohol dehydrogenase-like predicted oxidoreductase
MKTRRLGKSGPELTVIGFGAWAIGGPWLYGWGPVNDDESIAAIEKGLETGMNWIDTAAAYGFGHSETVVSRALRKVGRRVFVATKCGLISDGKGGAYRNSRPQSIRAELEGSLKRLEVDCIDLYQIHWPDANVPVEESWGEMNRFQEEGKVRYIGVSNYDVPLLKRCAAVAPVQSLQPPYSMLSRVIEKETLAYCEREGIGVVVYSPMQSGLLSGRFDKSKLAPDDWRREVEIFQEPQLSKNLALVEKLRPIADRYRITVGQLAIAWVLRHRSVTSAIVGARTSVQVKENAKGAAIEITPTDLVEIERLLQSQGARPS